MKLKNVINGHKNDREVLIVNINQSVKWNGKGIQRIVERYRKEWLEYEIINTSKDISGRTIINL